MAAHLPKQYLNINGRTVMEYALSRISLHPAVSGTAIALAPDDTHFALLPEALRRELIVVEGGAERCHSVLNCLRALRERAGADDWVLVHDAARPCVRRGDVDRLIEAVQAAGTGGILAVPVRDTMKRSDPAGRIEVTVERKALWHALTPQMFRLADLDQALDAAIRGGGPVTDEAQAMEHAGMQPLLVEGHADNMKVTRAEDLAIAELILARQEKEGCA